MMPLLAQSKTDEKKLLERIDYMIDNDKHYQDIKENELKHLKQLAFDAEDDKTRLLFLDSIYRAYSAYRYDSAYALHAAWTGVGKEGQRYLLYNSQPD